MWAGRKTSFQSLQEEIKRLFAFTVTTRQMNAWDMCVGVDELLEERDCQLTCNKKCPYAKS